MACDGYEHGTTVEVWGALSQLIQVKHRDLPGEDLPRIDFPHFRGKPASEMMSKRRFKNAVGWVVEVLRREHVLVVRYPKYVVRADAHAFHENSDQTKNNLSWIMKEEKISSEQMARNLRLVGLNMRVFNQLTVGGRAAQSPNVRAKLQIGEAIIDICRRRSGAEYDLRDIFPHEREFKR
jgi:hypothetical protein